MKHTFAVIALTFALAFSAYGQATMQHQHPAEKLSRQQLMALIATAKTPAEHERIAQYYDAQARKYLAESQEHAQMAEQYRKNPLISSSKWATGTVNHCEYIAQSLKDSATKMQELAALHQEMAKSAAQK